MIAAIAMTMETAQSTVNRGVHIVRMQWGKIVDIDANEDSQIVAEALKILAAHGVAEARAEPITS